MIELKEWLEYKLATAEEVNVSTASSWIAEFIEVERDIEGFKKREEGKKNTPFVNAKELYDEYYNTEPPKKSVEILVGSYQEALERLSKQYEYEPDKPIDYVTIQRLDVSLRLIGVKIESPVLDKIIDLVELLEDKKGNPTLEEITELETDWEDCEE